MDPSGLPQWVFASRGKTSKTLYYSWLEHLPIGCICWTFKKQSKLFILAFDIESVLFCWAHTTIATKLDTIFLNTVCSQWKTASSQHWQHIYCDFHNSLPALNFPVTQSCSKYLRLPAKLVQSVKQWGNRMPNHKFTNKVKRIKRSQARIQHDLMFLRLVLSTFLRWVTSLSQSK